MKQFYTLLSLLLLQTIAYAQDYVVDNSAPATATINENTVENATDYDNNVRFFAVAQGENEKNVSNVNLPLKARYNLNPSAIVFNGNSGLNTITVNKSGLYHIEGYFNMTVETFPPSRPLLQLFMVQFTGLQAPNSPAHMLFTEEMQDCRTCGRTAGRSRASGAFSLEVHIEAGQKIAFMPAFFPTTLSASYQFQVRGHLINE